MAEGNHVAVNADKDLDPACGGNTTVVSLVAHTRALAGRPTPPRRDSEAPAGGQEKGGFAPSHIVTHMGGCR